MGTVFFLRKEFVPSQDQGTVFIRMQTSPGSSIEFSIRGANWDTIVATAKQIRGGMEKMSSLPNGISSDPKIV